MPRATRSTPANRSPTRAAPAQTAAESASPSSNSPRKRARPDASLDMPDALEALEHKDSEGKVASGPRKTRRTGEAKQEDASNVGQPGGGESTEPAGGQDKSPLRKTRSSAAMVTDDEPAAPGEDGSQASSSTLEQAQDGEAMFDGSGLSAEQRRKAKGKGKAVQQEEVRMEDAGEDDELTRLRKELAVSKELMAQQQAALASVHSAIACAICTEPLDRPYSLQCGHVFCRKCLVTWFFRADPDEEDRQNAAEEQATGSSSSSSDHEDDASSSSGSIHSHMGGHINGRAFNITNLGDDDERKQRIFEATNEALLRYGFDLPPDVIRRSLSGVGGAADDEEEASNAGRIVEIEEDGNQKEEEREEEKQLTRDELRQKRLAALARFGFKVGDAADASASASSGRFEEVKDEEKGDEQPPFAGPSTSRAAPAATTNASASTSAPRRAEPAASAAPPAAPKSPLKRRPPPPPVPTGAHRAKNLVCPSCRAICSEHSPNRVFVLDEIVTSLRRSNVDESGSIGSNSGAWRARTETAEDGWPAMDEADESWGGLFPGPGGKESASDRRRRLAQIVRDRDDGVRRCGECNWELDERTGICEGCGRRWDISDDDSDDSDDGYTFGGLLGFGRHLLGRQHDDVELSGSDKDSDDDSQPARAALYDSQESYESDFVVKSDEEEEQERERTEARLRRRREAVRRRQRRLEATDSESRGSGSSGSSSASKTGSSSSEEDEDSDDERVARRRRRARRQQGEVIDLDSDTDSNENGSQGSSEGSGDGSSGSGSDSGSGSERGGGRGFLDDEVSVKMSKKKRIILDSDDDDDE